jgi:hypothetical protein
MVVMFQELKVKMFSDKPMERPAINQAQMLSTEELINQLILSINPCSSRNIFSIAKCNMTQLPKSLEFQDKKIHTRR